MNLVQFVALDCFPFETFSSFFFVLFVNILASPRSFIGRPLRSWFWLKRQLAYLCGTSQSSTIIHHWYEAWVSIQNWMHTIALCVFLILCSSLGYTNCIDGNLNACRSVSETSKKRLKRSRWMRLSYCKTVDHSPLFLRGISLWDICYDLLCIMPPLSYRNVIMIPRSIAHLIFANRIS